MKIELTLLGSHVNLSDQANSKSRTASIFQLTTRPGLNAIIVGFPGVAEALIPCEEAERMAHEILRHCQKKTEKTET